MTGVQPISKPDLATLLRRLRDGLPCIEANTFYRPCRLREARYGCDCAAAADAIDRLMKAVLMGLELAESGGHGNGLTCPTCHFVRHARHALGLVVPDIKTKSPTEQ